MKKIILVAAIAMAGFVTQATTLTWGLQSGVTMSDFAGGTAYLVWNNVSSEVLSYDGDLEKATSFSVANVKDTTYSQQSVDANGFFSVKEAVTPSSTGLAAGNKPSYILIFSADGKKMAVTQTTASVNIQNSTMSSTFTRDADAFKVYTAIVPEPCTAALLALGLAAFGLKRKVA